ncbi:NAD-dependent epimerase [Streptomyces sp. ASQP_92]|uniref:nuclear transport factor 2 family protein n=1 Tax=Streptomyces sp. ASQP_92 TaxID=2979116 RepID=UPI0021C085EF|nr:nuclear transport factor 2 family protein [Streptomyces sp. ASQP_92]MCT9088934.1 NAD-dependent epimerase [Streptomyces sp. ASQP_92]
MKPQVAGVSAAQEDVDAIVALVAEFEYAQQNALPDAFVGLFRHDAFWSIPYGTALTGIDEIGVFARRVLPGTVGQQLTSSFETEYIQFIRPDVAVVRVRHRPVTRDGELLDNLLSRHREGKGRRGCRESSEAGRRWASLVAACPGVAPGTALHLMTKTDGRWLVAFAQSTVPVEAAEPVEVDLPAVC